MPFEYLAMDAVIFGPAFIYASARRRLSVRQWLGVFASIILVATPFVAWDVAVTGHHWWFDARYVVGVELLGLPVEEWLFFVAVPFACLFLWITVFAERGRARPGLRRAGLWVGISLTALAAVVWMLGPQYSALALLALGSFLVADCTFGVAASTHGGAPRFALAVVLLTVVFDGFLTARPVVHYAPSAISGVRLGSIPIEDFGYGLALVGSVVAVFEFLMKRR